MKKILILTSYLAMMSSSISQVMINEVLYDTPGTDDTSIMFTELYGPPGTNLDGWTLVNINGNGGAEHISVSLEGNVPDDGYFVVGGGSVGNVDQISPHDFQNAGSAPSPSCDWIDLEDCNCLSLHG